MKKLRTIAFIITALFLMCACAPRAHEKGNNEDRCLSEDGVSLLVSLLLPAVPEKAPGLILVHGFGTDHHVWDGFAAALQQGGIMTAAVDLRGHGGSRMQEKTVLHFSALSTDDFRNTVHDIKAAKNCLLEAGADPDNLAVIGEGLGANLALRYALEDPQIQAVVMLSPGLDYKGITSLDEIKKLKDCPVLLVACEDDAYSAMTVSALKAAAPVFAELRTWTGSAQGSEIFAIHPEAIHYITTWLRQIIQSR